MFPASPLLQPWRLDRCLRRALSLACKRGPAEPRKIYAMNLSTWLPRKQSITVAGRNWNLGGQWCPDKNPKIVWVFVLSSIQNGCFGHGDPPHCPWWVGDPACAPVGSVFLYSTWSSYVTNGHLAIAPKSGSPEQEQPWVWTCWVLNILNHPKHATLTKFKAKHTMEKQRQNSIYHLVI
jgi:hypothetical protein